LFGGRGGACARPRAPCEPFEAAPSFLCRGVDAARKCARCPAIANFTLLATKLVASYCVLLRAVANWSIWPARTADQPVWEGERKAPAAEEGGAGLDRRTNGRSMNEERERGETRAQEVPSSKRGRAVPPTPRDPYYRQSTMKDAEVRGLHLAVFLCASFYTGGSGRNAAATAPANDAFIQLKWAAPRRNRSSSRRRPRSAIFESN